MCTPSVRVISHPAGSAGPACTAKGPRSGRVSALLGQLRITAPRGSFVGCLAGALSKGEYEAGLAAAGFEQISVQFTHEVADGMHGAIIKAVKVGEPTAHSPSMAQPATQPGCC